ncbi:MAG: flagellar protein FlgN [bacterium]|nr:flagellar protein FlgN [bacterium]
MHTRKARLLDEDGRLLASLLEVEDHNYRRLLRLAWRQNSYMKRQDVDRLEANASDWQSYLPRANEARGARERFVKMVVGGLGLADSKRTRDLLPYLGAEPGLLVRRALADLDRTMARLARQNELNRHLAEFCLELAREEARIFREVLLDDPAGCYGQDAVARTGGTSRMVQKQA